MKTEKETVPPADAGRLDAGVGRLVPERVTLSRAKDWRMPPNTVKVDRTTKWGNPFKVGQRNDGGQRRRCLQCEKGVAMTKSTGRNASKTHWTAAMDAAVKLLYPNTVSADIAKQLGIGPGALYRRAYILGLKKSTDFVASTARARMTPDHPGRKTQFKSGLTPWNMGMKGLQYEGMSATQFKKGQTPHTLKPIGSYRTVNNNLEMKVNDNPGGNHVRWHPVHRTVWEAANGPVPKGHICVFRPGMHTAILENITIDRIECISRAENSRRNHPRSIHPELGRLVQLRGAITRQINRRSKDLVSTGVTS